PGAAFTGEAVALDAEGRPVLATGDGVQRPVGAGDIVHRRPLSARPAAEATSQPGRRLRPLHSPAGA
ncbi:hypothetical protein CLM85_33295, partial [Streptomyces albidoflavus]